MDPDNTGSFSSKQFIEIVSHYNLIGTLKDFKVNMVLVLHCIYEGLEYGLNSCKTNVA